MTRAAADPGGKLAENIAHFARALRAGGMNVGPGRVVEAVRAVEAAGLKQRDFRAALAACFISRPEHIALFDQTFSLFWRDPELIERMKAALLPMMRAPEHERERKAAESRAEQAMLNGATPPPAPKEDGEEIEFDASLTASAEERLAARDFEQMTVGEARAARAAIARLTLPVQPIATRRKTPSARGGAPDWRATMRAGLRHGELRELRRRSPAQRWPDLVALCDISGSMANYSRMLLHFLHAASNARGAGWARVHCFTFGTRLTNITRHMRWRDPDDALRLSGAEALDWEGGTRIGHCLRDFNHNWSRRVLGRGAAVLLITDGLDRDDPALLGREAERLNLSCRKLIWLNPLLRWDGFAPKAGGVRALLPHVDSFRAAHDINSLKALAAALTRPDDSGEKARLMKMLREDL